MTPNTQKRSAGFTIIELLIVVAVGGLILSIVLLAIPTLERNSRNGQRKQDVAAVLQEVSRYQLNNSGAFPSNQIRTFTSLTDPSLSDLASKVNLTYYDKQGIRFIAQSPDNRAGGSAPLNNNAEAVNIYNYVKCKTDDPGKATIVGAGFNDIAALYNVETSNGVAGQCVQL